MGDGTSIEWTEASWNPLRARDCLTRQPGWYCEIISPGCQNCYAQAINKRLGTGSSYLKKDRRVSETYLDEKLLAQPLRWRRPRRIFVCSMSDLFGEWVPDEMIDRIFAVMALCPQHTFQVLTKRAERMRDYMRGLEDPWKGHADRPRCMAHAKNLWLGVSVEDQRRADERIPLLLETPAAVRWVSAEPLLEAVDFHQVMHAWRMMTGSEFLRRSPANIDWIVVGGESGPGARPFNIDWARSIIAQCQAAGVACFVKQLGAKPYWQEDATAPLPLRDHKGGAIEEWPADLRIREYPVPQP